MSPESPLKLGSLCSGIGGLELGLERAIGCETVWQVELEPHCRAVLAAHWPNAKRFDDVHQVGAHNLDQVDLICFGSPCQDLSSAGKRAGLGGPKSRIFYECARVVSELRPEWVVVENVASGAARWVDAMRSELGQRGYATLPVPVAARDCGAPHRRERIFLVAHAEREFVRQQSGGRRAGQGQCATPCNPSLPTLLASHPESLRDRRGRNILPTLTTNRSTWQQRRGVKTRTLQGIAQDEALTERDINLVQQTRAVLPTLTARDEKGPAPTQTKGGRNLGGHLSPAFCEWFMGFPLGWTEPVIGSPRSATRARRSKRKSSATSSESLSKPSNSGAPDV